MGSWLNRAGRPHEHDLVICSRDQEPRRREKRWRWKKSFEISELELADKANRTLFLLKPKAEEGVFESIHILFEENKLVELLMTDSVGQNTNVKFSKVVINKKLDTSLFSFVIPEGVDVVDSRDKY